MDTGGVLVSKDCKVDCLSDPNIDRSLYPDLFQSSKRESDEDSMSDETRQGVEDLIQNTKSEIPERERTPFR